LLALQRCLRLAAIELCCLPRRALVGELALECRAVFPCAFFGPVGALAGGLGALLGACGALVGLVGERVASLGVFCGAGRFPAGGASACLGFAGVGVGLVAVVFGGACALQCAVAVLLGLLGARELARGSLLGLPGGALGRGLRGDGGLGAGGGVLGAALGVFGERLGVACSRLGVARSLAGGLFCRLCLRGDRPVEAAARPSGVPDRRFRTRRRLPGGGARETRFARCARAGRSSGCSCARGVTLAILRSSTPAAAAAVAYPARSE
jgi:hypothetical protein